MQKRRYSGYKKYITDEELKELDRYFAEQVTNQQVRLCYLLCRYLGIRISDACRFHKTWLQGDRIVFTMQKTKKVLELPLIQDSPLKRYLDAYLMIFKDNIDAHDGYLCFSTRKNNHLSPNTLRYEFVNFRRRLHYLQPYYIRQGIKSRPMFRLSVHVLRHRVLTQIYKKTKNIVLCQNIAGHTRPDTTLRYYIDDATLEEKKEAMEQII